METSNLLITYYTQCWWRGHLKNKIYLVERIIPSNYDSFFLIRLLAILFLLNFAAIILREIYLVKLIKYLQAYILY